MIVKISPSQAFGRVKAPPSKSMAHRLLICGALSKQSVISGVAFSKDIEATLGCLKALGARINIENDIVTIGGITGTVVNVKEDRVVIETGADQVRIEIEKWGIGSNKTAAEAAKAKAKKDEEAKAKAKAAKKSEKSK